MGKLKKKHPEQLLNLDREKSLELVFIQLNLAVFSSWEQPFELKDTINHPAFFNFKKIENLLEILKEKLRDFKLFLCKMLLSLEVCVKEKYYQTLNFIIHFSSFTFFNFLAPEKK